MATSNPPLSPSPTKGPYSRPFNGDKDDTSALTQRLTTKLTVDGELYTPFDLIEMAKSHDATEQCKFVVIFEKIIESLRELEYRCDTYEAALSNGPPKIEAKRSDLIRDPAKFVGKVDQPEAWEDFKMELLNKLEGDADFFLTNTHKIDYLIFRLDVGPQAIVTKYRRAHPRSTFAEILGVLDTTYGNQLMELNTGIKLQKCKQLNKPFKSWVIKFRVLACRSRLDDRVVCQYLKQNISQELKNLLPTIRGHWDMGFEELAEVLNDYSDTMHAYPILTKANNRAPSSDRSSDSPSAASTPANRTANNASKPRGPLTAEERKHRREKCLCMYCGNSGHQVVACPNRKPVP